MPRHCPSRSTRHPNPLPITSRRPRRVTCSNTSGRKLRQPPTRTGQSAQQQSLAMTNQSPTRQCLTMTARPGTSSRRNNLLLPRRRRRSLRRSSSRIAPGEMKTGKPRPKRNGFPHGGPQVPLRGGPRATTCKDGTQLPKERTRRPHDRSNRALSFLKCRFSDLYSDCLLGSALGIRTRFADHSSSSSTSAKRGSLRMGSRSESRLTHSFVCWPARGRSPNSRSMAPSCSPTSARKQATLY
jgi:hypothetical protein